MGFLLYYDKNKSDTEKSILKKFKKQIWISYTIVTRQTAADSRIISNKYTAEKVTDKE